MPPVRSCKEQTLFVDTLLGAVQTVQDLVQVVRLDHEFLQAFHGNLCHFSRGITVKELGNAARGVRGQHFKALFQELVLIHGRLGVYRELAEVLAVVDPGLDVRRDRELQELACVFLVLGIGRNVEGIGRCVFRLGDARRDFHELVEIDLVIGKTGLRSGATAKLPIR